MVFALCFRPWTHTADDKLYLSAVARFSDSYCIFLIFWGGGVARSTEPPKAALVFWWHQVS